MSILIFDSKDSSLDDQWTTGRFTDELFLNLASVKERIQGINDKDKNVIVTVHKYYFQAREKMFRIPLYKENMPFIIHLSDLTDRVKDELEQYYKEVGLAGITMVLKMAVMKLFENLNFEYTHLSVMKHLVVKVMH